uniref:Uncharacterized protein n=1 Tax=Ignisphaera aggregans TaxID=334771 RepID=A0A7C2ZQ74_9CREN
MHRLKSKCFCFTQEREYTGLWTRLQRSIKRKGRSTENVAELLHCCIIALYTVLWRITYLG